MSPSAASLRDAIGAALASPVDGPLAVALRAPTVTAIVADPRDEAALTVALPVMLAALDRAGVPRGRAFVLLAATHPVEAARACARALRLSAGVPVIAHDPGASRCFLAGRTSLGTPLELDDELREAEAVVALGSLAPGEADRGPGALVLPGLASAAAVAVHLAHRSAGERARDAREALATLGLDFGVAWREDGGVAHAWAGSGASAWTAASGAGAS